MFVVPKTTLSNVWMGWTYGPCNQGRMSPIERTSQGFEDCPFHSWAFLNQTHSDIVHAVEQAGTQGEGDAQFTSIRNLGLVVQTADCVPIFLIGGNQNYPQVGVVHAGWKGLANQILPKTIEAMNGVHTAIIGPCIGVHNYEVGEEVIHAVLGTGVERSACVIEGSPRPFLAVRAVAACQLKQFGVDQIEMSSACTYTDSGWASYRRDKERSGRILSIIGICG